MVIESLLTNNTTKEYLFKNFKIFIFKKEPERLFKLNLGDDYFIYVVDGNNNSVTRDVANKLSYCYSSNGYAIVNTMSIDHELQRIARCLNDR